MENEHSKSYYPFESDNGSENTDNLAFHTKERPKRFRPRIGISMGDFNGIGVEVILKTLTDTRVLDLCIPVIFGAARVFSHYKKLLNIDFTFQQHFIDDENIASSIHQQKTNIVNCSSAKIEIEAGKVTAEAGACALAALEGATKAMQEGWIDALVTAPINKDNIQSETFNFPGHTEYLTEKFSKDKVKDSLMFLIHENLRVGVVTGHIPLKDVPTAVTAEKITSKLNLMLHSLKQDFGIAKPKVALLGLNPHAGENGLLGSEEKEIILPVIEKFRQKEHLVYGAFPSDGFFGAKEYEKFDGILAMYHDQGLIPFKTLAFNEGINFTAGLPVVRTSPDHGTAYGIAGKNSADESSFRNALFLAIDTVKSRIDFEITNKEKMEHKQRRKEERRRNRG
ncbi:4-hydroxythreonine-4-phosphate dehydrogenase [Bernardetia litoralis DSM 6794]|uniref:4-hydroxythreonine-4-phosphate dehydrogenase n=1 Tax=Bernardetia litoralis (strain ATCC 23117 / DSM 6794 / NBRC 15988 / NCIMB 1366 / Fx l1 / Sio-4) TaxID=880071 RepID=I4AG95_BERLS|nr:4-hydroxythreonine-4-phosphate dehydrogenase PdxA [Bernardetia litoralis]AFM02980.1 4-hydroxythreonine-4-phosphate dehydrogenase [Bernardetia litoralis DSM 6794]